MDLYEIGFSNIRLPNDKNNYLYTYSPIINLFPEEVFVHEFLHSLERVMNENNYDIPALHDYEKYEYKEEELVRLKRWYKDYMTKNILDTATNKYIGLDPKIYEMRPVHKNDFKYALEVDFVKDPKNIYDEVRMMINMIINLVKRKEYTMKVSDFNYYLPKELIAQHPLEKRDSSRLMVLNRQNKEIEHKTFIDIIDCLEQGDCLVINNTKVIPARLYGNKITDGQVSPQNNIEILLLKNFGNDIWEVMVRPGKKIREGAKIAFGVQEGEIDNHLLLAEILEVLPNGNRKIKFEYEGIFNEILDKIGLMPLPPYIKEKLEKKERYQTVYAKHDGSAAAPTAGLHFTEELLKRIKEKGVEIANVTLHVGIGTFRPVKVEDIEKHDMHSEHFYIKEEDAKKINKAKKEGHKIIACGTTSCRVLETIANTQGLVEETEGDTSIFIYPGYDFKCVDNLITNFHLPESTLIMLVSSLAGKDFIMSAYEEAVREKYRFFSFGDAMLII